MTLPPGPALPGLATSAEPMLNRLGPPGTAELGLCGGGVPGAGEPDWDPPPNAKGVFDADEPGPGTAEEPKVKAAGEGAGEPKEAGPTPLAEGGGELKEKPPGVVAGEAAPKLKVEATGAGAAEEVLPKAKGAEEPNEGVEDAPKAGGAAAEGGAPKAGEGVEPKEGAEAV